MQYCREDARKQREGMQRMRVRGSEEREKGKGLKEKQDRGKKGKVC